ncbi:MAG: hypothetical protein AAFX79_09175 [Planctomycetota bacterium]
MTPDPPHADARRPRLRATLRWLARGLLLATLGGWALAVVATDRTAASQWLFWTPREAWLVLAVALAVPATLFTPRPQRLRRWLPAIAAGVLVLHTAFLHWRLANVVLRPSGPTALRLAHWNATEATDASLQAFLREQDPFAIGAATPGVVVLANPPLRLPWEDIVRALAPRELTGADLTRHLARAGRVVFISGAPISRSGSSTLGLAGRTRTEMLDRGRAAFAELDTEAGPIVLWAIDWPSDPSIVRIDMVRPSRESIDTSVHRRFGPTAAGPMRATRTTGFPPADVVLGDFNTARGSAAVDALLPGMASAHAQAGIGPGYAWPRDHVFPGIPLLALDQAFVRRDAWRATRYRVHDTGSGVHRAQLLAITPAR